MILDAYYFPPVSARPPEPTSAPGIDPASSAVPGAPYFARERALDESERERDWPTDEENL